MYPMHGPNALLAAKTCSAHKIRQEQVQSQTHVTEHDAFSMDIILSPPNDSVERCTRFSRYALLCALLVTETDTASDHC